MKEIKIDDLDGLIILKKKASLLYNFTDIEFYKENYIGANLSFLLENEERINKDFEDNIGRFKFNILMDEQLIWSVGLRFVNNLNLEDFSCIVSIIPFSLANKRLQNKLVKQYNEFLNFKNDTYLKVAYLIKNKR